jgi:hypothetical protein
VTNTRFQDKIQIELPVIFPTQKGEIGRISVQRQPRQIVPKTLSLKNPLKKKKGW